MSRRYYPSTRDRLTRALDEGVKADGRAPLPYSSRNSGKGLRDAYLRGWHLSLGFAYQSRLPVVDLSAEFADMVAEIEADAAKWLECVL